MKTHFTLLLVFLCLTTFAQQVTNVHAAQEGKQVIITYDITGANSGDKLEVKLFYAQNNTNWREAILGLTGDVGADVTPGTGKSIHWSPLKELNKLTGSDYTFKVKATLKASDPYDIAANMVVVTGGTYIMGCTGEQGGDCSPDEQPSHHVTLSSFYISKYDVTQAQWQAVMGGNPSGFKDCDNCPVESVSWIDVQEFISKLNAKTGKNYRLPTEAEWEYAARGGNQSRGYTYSGGNDIDAVAWYNSNSGNKTHPVGQKQANELGLYDMSGNVCQWCSDWFSDYKPGSANNPKGPGTGTSRVARGGSWYDDPGSYRLSDRRSITPGYSNGLIGFRLAQD